MIAEGGDSVESEMNEGGSPGRLATMGAGRPWWKLRTPSATVLLVLLAASLVMSLVTRELVQRQEHELLNERASDVQVVVSQLFGQVQTSLSAAGATVVAGAGDPAAFERNVSTLVSPGSSLWLLQRHSSGEWVVIARAGTALPSQVVTPEAAAVLGEARASRTLHASPVYTSDGQRRVGFAFASAAMTPDMALYLQTPLSPPGTPTRVQSNAFSEVNVALYSGGRQQLDQLILTNTLDLPLSGNIEVRPVAVGADQWIVAVAPEGTLVGALTSKLPWAALLVMSLGSVAITMLMELVARRRDEALLQVGERSQETDSILEAAEDAFISIDSSGTVVRWNRKAAELFGWSAAEALGKRISELIIPEEYRERHERGIERFLETGDGPVVNQRVEVEAFRRDGTRFPVELAIWPIEHNGDYRFNAFLHDITARRQAAEELSEAHRQAVDASRLKSEFLANMSHEIRTPMNGVIGMTGLLLRTDLDTEQREYAETVRASAEALLNVINDILDFSKIEAGRLALEVVDFELRSTVEEAADLLADHAHVKGLEMVVSVSRDVPTVLRGDAGRIRQVLLNLVANAVKFTDRGEVVIRCSLDRADDNEVVVHFAVTDTGIGISEAEQARVFDTFTQVDASTTKRHEGTGLGLAIVRQLTELMGGETGLESTPGEGSTFWFTARLERGNERSVNEGAQAAGMADVAVLVVDDNATNTRILMHTLQDWGMRPVSAAGALEAVGVLQAAAATGTPYRLALLDYHMPDLDGLDLARSIVAIPEISDTKLILLTSSGDRADLLGYREAGVTACLTKPVRQAVLRSRIAEVLQYVGATGTNETPVNATGQMKTSSAFHVLVAEDNVVNQRVASRMLEKIGCTVDLVANGQEAVDAVQRQSYALVFMDCQMPEKDGYEAAQEIRSWEATSGGRVPIVAMTASAMEGDRELAIAAGMDDYLSKPVQLESVFDAVERWAVAPRPSPAAVGEVLDLRVVEALRSMGMPDGTSLLAELVQRFDESAHEQLVQLREAIENDDHEAIRRVAHTLRGSGGAVGAKELSLVCTRLEEEITPDSYDADAVAADVVLLERLVDLTVESLRTQASIEG